MRFTQKHCLHFGESYALCCLSRTRFSGWKGEGRSRKETESTWEFDRLKMFVGPDASLSMFDFFLTWSVSYLIIYIRERALSTPARKHWLDSHRRDSTVQNISEMLIATRELSHASSLWALGAAMEDEDVI